MIGARMETLARNLTYEEWLQMPTVQDGTDEVVNGELRFMPPTHYPHAEIVQRFIEAVIPQVDRKKIRVLGSNLGLMIQQEPLTCRTPDLVMFWRDRMTMRDGLYWSPPALVVEVISPSERRRQKQGKLDDFARIGVAEAWLISPEAEHVSIYLLSDGKLTLSKIVADGELQPTQFPGVSIPVAELWPEVA
jgi:Uma2 family endonuclease